MKVTPLDIRRKEFKRSMRGYADEEVDIFLDEVADEFERVFQENIELHDRLHRLEEQLQSHAQLKDALEKTLVSAQLQADQITANARKEAELIMRDAELKARDIVAESYSETQKVQQALVQLKHLEEEFRFKFRSLLEGHLNLLNDVSIALPTPGGALLAPATVGEPPVLTAAESRTALPLEQTVAAPAAAAPPAAEAAPPRPESEAEVGSVPERELTLRHLQSDGPVGDDGQGGNGRSGNGGGGDGQAQLQPETALSQAEAEVEPEVVAEVQTIKEYGSGGSGPWRAPLTAPPRDDDVPTQETEPPLDAVTEAAELRPAEEYPSALDDEEQPVQGFFFGKRIGEGDGDFTLETLKKEKGRDFEW